MGGDRSSVRCVVCDEMVPAEQIDTCFELRADVAISGIRPVVIEQTWYVCEFCRWFEVQVVTGRYRRVIAKYDNR